MSAIKAVLSAAAFLVLGLGFAALVVWEWRSGLVAGKFGAVDLFAMPGVSAFLLALQIGLAALFVFSAASRLSALTRSDAAPRADPGRADALVTLAEAGAMLIVTAFGLWAVWDFAKAGVGVVSASSDDLASRAITGGLLLVVIAVFVVLLYTMLAQPLVATWWPRVRAALRRLAG